MQAQSELELYTQPENKMPLDRISVSSDAFGSAPVFDRHGKLTRYEASDSLQPSDCSLQGLDSNAQRAYMLV